MIRGILFLGIILSSVLYGSDGGNVTTRIIYYIHGDASYLFHDDTGREINSDERMLQQALCIARSPGNSEVFILHHRAAKTIFLFFTLKNIDLYHFKEGKLLEKKTYGLGHDSALEYLKDYIKFEGNSLNNYRNYFLFYGHKIPEDEGFGYNASQPDKPLNVNMIRQGLSSLGLKFELIVLSTCKNGTPYTISQLSGLAKYIIASPEDLPLYNISSKPFILAVRNPGISTDGFARFLAKYSFRKLKTLTFTILTISLYDIQHLTDMPPEKGVMVLYNPPRFGKYRNIKSHSGWGYSEQNIKE